MSLHLTHRLEVRPDERVRLARILHDGLAQELALLGYYADRLIGVLARPTNEPAEEGLVVAREVRRQVTALLGDLRATVAELRSPLGSERTLADALTAYSRPVDTDRALTVHLLLSQDTSRLAETVETQVLAIAQAAIDRVRLRADAQNLWVTLAVDAAGCQLTIEDDAHDLDVGDDDDWQVDLTVRAQQIGARLLVGPRHPTGHQVRLTLPVAS